MADEQLPSGPGGGAPGADVSLVPGAVLQQGLLPDPKTHAMLYTAAVEVTKALTPGGQPAAFDANLSALDAHLARTLEAAARNDPAVQLRKGALVLVGAGALMSLLVFGLLALFGGGLVDKILAAGMTITLSGMAVIVADPRAKPTDIIREGMPKFALPRGAGGSKQGMSGNQPVVGQEGNGGHQ